MEKFTDSEKELIHKLSKRKDSPVKVGQDDLQTWINLVFKSGLSQYNRGSSDFEEVGEVSWNRMYCRKGYAAELKSMVSDSGLRDIRVELKEEAEYPISQPAWPDWIGMGGNSSTEKQYLIRAGMMITPCNDYLYNKKAKMDRYPIIKIDFVSFNKDALPFGFDMFVRKSKSVNEYTEYCSQEDGTRCSGFKLNSVTKPKETVKLVRMRGRCVWKVLCPACKKVYHDIPTGSAFSRYSGMQDFFHHLMWSRCRYVNYVAAYGGVSLMLPIGSKASRARYQVQTDSGSKIADDMRQPYAGFDYILANDAIVDALANELDILVDNTPAQRW
jgi:hypothetical protein